MRDEIQMETAQEATTFNGQTFDLVVIGAGIAGLNALSSASEYLPKGARVLLLDQKSKPGGMWTTVYDYVRLHQPHPMFTVGNQKWGWSKPRQYLPVRDEVQAHLAKCVDATSGALALSESYETTVVSCHEDMTPDGPRAQVVFHPNGADADLVTVTAHQVIEAEGVNYEVPQPLALSSSAVHSITPNTLRDTLTRYPDVPVFVIGGGKTGMDSVIEVLNQKADRMIGMLVGKGTDFFNRNENLPIGLKRWTSGIPVSRVFHDIAMRFDGDNEAETAAHFRANYATERNSDNRHFLYGLLSEEERDQIEAGLAWRKYDYLQDVVDDADGPTLALRSGETISIPSGSIIVNCTGNLFRGQNLAVAKPCLSSHGTILSINVSDALHFLTSACGFFTPHLHFRGVLKDHGFYTIDMEGLFRKNREAWVAATSTQAYLTQALAVQHLPLSVLDRCGIDLDRWYPLPRRMAALIKMKSTAAKDIAHCQKALDRVAERFDVQCGPLTPGDRSL